MSTTPDNVSVLKVNGETRYSWRVGKVSHGVIVSYSDDDIPSAVHVSSSSEAVRPCTFDLEAGEAAIIEGGTAFVLTLGESFEILTVEEYAARFQERLQERLEAALEATNEDEDTDEEEDEHDAACAE